MISQRREDQSSTGTYYQLKASPGMWFLHAGDSATVVGQGGAEGMQLVTVDSWRGAHHTVRVRKERAPATAAADKSAPAALRRALSGFFGSEGVSSQHRLCIHSGA